MRLYDILRQTAERGRVPYHMPGHKRSSAFDYLGETAELDFTEIDGLDDLHSPDGILLDTMELARETYGSDRAFLLVNGSTCGILSTIYTLCRDGRPLIAARNAHKSVYNAAAVCKSHVHYIMPRLSEDGLVLDVPPETVEHALDETPDAAALLITSPTYDGVVSDVSRIADICHAHGVPLIVDAAHGAHLGFLDKNIPSPVTCGADAVIMSLHKTLPSLTQTGLLHISGELIDADAVAQSLSIFETSSPSYILMASIDGCLHEMKRDELFHAWSDRLCEVRRAARECRRIHLRDPLASDGVYAFDSSKLILSCDDCDGEELAYALRHECGIEPEMTAPHYVLLMSGAGDTVEMTETLCRALSYLDSEARFSGKRSNERVIVPFEPPECVLTIAEARSSTAVERVTLEEACRTGRVAAEAVMPYPPGIPLIAPGERITPSVVSAISEGINVLTSHGRFDGYVYVVSRTDMHK